MTKKFKEKFVIVSGLSGAGISSALRVLEDLRFHVYDNFPPFLVENLLNEEAEQETQVPVAVGIDTRSSQFDPKTILKLKKQHGAELVFMSCDRLVLEKRYSETRRVHPLAKDRPIGTGIEEEMRITKPLRAGADQIIDTTAMSIHDLKKLLANLFSFKTEEKLTVTIMSFGFKHGLPSMADIIMDVRFLKNPHWEADLKPLTGEDDRVGDYIKTDPAFKGFLDKFKALIEEVLPRYQNEGKSYLTIAIGCTGGKHRSVYTSRLLAKWLEDRDVKAHIQHRDIDYGALKRRKTD